MLLLKNEREEWELPEERLAAAARWTGKALVVAEWLGDPVFLAHALRSSYAA